MHPVNLKASDGLRPMMGRGKKRTAASLGTAQRQPHSLAAVAENWAIWAHTDYAPPESDGRKVLST